MEISSFKIERYLQDWLDEDIGSGDITTNSIVSADARTKAVIHAKESGRLAGCEVAVRVFHLLDNGLDIQILKKDGDFLKPGDIIAEIEGNARAILTGERLALNILQHLSGIATRTANFVKLVDAYQTRIVDTRKTMPGLRLLEKYAVRVGGGHNHRLGLFDAVLIKDNHIAVAGGICPAIELARRGISHTSKIEIEVESLAEVQQALSAGADIIMLDNMDPVKMKSAVELIGKKALTEASGGISEHNIEAAAAAGVDVISIGALTHSIKALDISLDIGAIK